jgi:hypothetical protein
VPTPFAAFVAPHVPGKIQFMIRGFAGMIDGSIVAIDQNGGGDPGVPAPMQTYVWDRDGLFAGGLMDATDSSSPSFMYQGGDDMLRSAIQKQPNGDVFFVASANADMRVYKVAGWDNWQRSSGQVVVQSASPTAGIGLSATYFDNDNLTVPKTTRVDGPIDFDWGSQIPSGTALTAADSCSVSWSGSVQPTYGPRYVGSWRRREGGSYSDALGGAYRETQGDVGVDLSDPNLSAHGSYVEITFPGNAIQVWGVKSVGYGQADVYVDSTNFSSPYYSSVSWSQSADNGNSTTSEIFRVTNLSPGDHTVRIRAQSDLRNWINVDHFIISSDNFATTSTIDDEGVPYTFYVTAGDGVRLTVNRQSLIDDWMPQGASVERAISDVYLNWSSNPIQLSVFKAGGPGRFSLKWSSPYEAKQVVPQRALFP